MPRKQHFNQKLTKKEKVNFFVKKLTEKTLTGVPLEKCLGREIYF